MTDLQKIKKTEKILGFKLHRKEFLPEPDSQNENYSYNEVMSDYMLDKNDNLIGLCIRNSLSDCSFLKDFKQLKILTWRNND